MIDPEVDRLARERIGPRMEARRRLFTTQIELISNQLHRAPATTRQAIQHACEGEAAVRAELSWAELQAVLAATGTRFTEQLAYDLRVEVRRHVDVGDLVRIVNGVAGDDWRVRGAADRQLELLGSDIDLYVVKLKRAAEDQGRPGQPIYNFGVVQTGTYSTATVVQHFGTEERRAIHRALDELRTQVAGLEASELSDKAEVVELIDEARAEIAKERPNRRRLTSVLGGVATTIQTVGAAQAAYVALKVAASAVGITLP